VPGLRTLAVCLLPLACALALRAGDAAPSPAPAATPSTQSTEATPSTPAPAAGADTAALIDGILDNGRAWLEENFETEELEPLTPEQIHQLASRLQPIADALAIGSIEDFAALRPQAAELLAWLRTQSWGTPYADWLAPRMDYLDLAADAVETSRRQWEAEQQRLRSQPPDDPAQPPAERPRPTLRFEIVRDRVYRTALSNSTWKRRIAERTPPARAAELAPVLKDAFRAEGVAPEWIWLAEVESSFDPEAQSPSGARGLFQFMPATAKRFGLSTFPFDERTHPQKSARAAAQYLRYLHTRFGDWPLAFAAYNAGEGRISRALEKARRNSFDEIADRLPAETRFYVPKVLATVAARENVDPFALPAPGKPLAQATVVAPILANAR
jgi:membrane-bound lytic murein transglycosylase D